MAGESPQLAELARQMAALDDDALAALANKGLVRRAHKDLQKELPQHTGAAGKQLTFAVEGQRVLLGSVPTAAKCDCGAGSICRHVIAAVLYLRDHLAAAAPAAPTEPTGDPLAEIMALTPNDLATWAGKGLFRRSLDAPRDDARCETGPPVTITLPTLNATVRWLDGQGLGGMLCTCHAAGACTHKVAAVLALWSHGGRTSPELPARVLETAPGAPRTRDEVLASVKQVLCEMVALGLERVSEATQNRLKTLAVSAHGVDLPRLERTLNALATQTELLLKRDAQGDAARVLQIAALTWALASALARPTPALVGVHRTKYDQVSGELELIGLGAQQWHTPSGYAGLTVYFWEPKAGRWNTWTVTRPATQQFDPRMQYGQEFPWPGVSDPREASRSHYRVSGVFRNPVGRLSGRPGARAVRIDDTQLTQVPSVTQWPKLIPTIERIFGGGLTQQIENQGIVLLAPAQVEAAEFDDVNQALQRPLLDADGRVLPLRLAYDERIPRAVEHVESIKSADLLAVLALLRAGPEGIYARPITLATPNGLIHITLDGTATPRNRAYKSTRSTPDEVDANVGPEFDLPDAPLSPVGLLLQQALDQIEAAAEAGLRVQRDLAPLRAASAAFATLGLATCRDAIHAAADAVEQSRRSRPATDAAGRLLECGYVLRLALQQETTALWSRQFS